MKEKMIDIVPPFEKKKDKKVYYEHKKEGGAKKVFLPLALLGLILAGYFYYASYRTEITISPIMEEFTQEQKVLALATGAINEGEVRARIFKEKVKGAQEFDIEERRLVEEKAEGEIEVCQNHSDVGASYVEGTRFVSENGKLFIAEERVNLPGRTYEDGKVVAGCAQIAVVAAEPGEEYNIPSNSKFSLPGLHGTAHYGRVEGRSITLRKEGFRGEVPYLGEGERARVEKEMADELFSRGMEKIAAEHGEDYLFRGEDQYRMEIAERFFESKDDNEEKAVLEIEISVEAIAIKKSDMNDYLSALLPENYTWEDKETNYSFSRIDFEDGRAEFDLTFSASIYEKINKELMRKELLGLSFEEAKRKLEEDIEAEWISFRTLPFGAQRVSRNIERVGIVLEFDKI